MKWAAERKFITAGFGLALAILLLVGLVTSKSTTGMLEAVEERQHSFQVSIWLEALLSSLKDAETGQRGYLITGEDLYLARYQIAREKAPELFRDLQQFTVNDRRYQRRMAPLEALIAGKFQELEEAVALRRTKGFSAAAQLVLTDRGKRIMDEIRSLVSAIEQEDKELRRRLSLRVEATTRSMVYTLIAGNAASVAILLVVFFLLNRQIAERRRAEEALEDQTRVLQSVLGNMGDGVIVADENQKFLIFNPAAERMFGHGATATTSEQWSRQYGLYLPDQTTPFPAADLPLARAVRGEACDDVEMFVRHEGAPQGIWVRISGRALRDEDGKVKGGVIVCRDVTEQKRMLLALEEKAVYARSLIEASLDPLVTISPDGKITDVNEATIKVAGLRREELVGTDFSNYFTEPEMASEGYRQVFKRGLVVDYPLTIRHVSGRLTPVLYNASVYKDLAGNALGVFAAARDITVQKRAEEALQKAHDELESRVQERTAELTRANQNLQAEMAERRRAEETVTRQAREILEMSTPVVEVWEGIVVAPLIGTLDSQRTERFMEQLLERIVETRSPVALVDITGVPAIDTQTSQHLIETINAVRLLGAQVVLTGIRPAIAQTLVHLGIDLGGVVTRPSLAAGLRYALDGREAQLAPKRIA